MHGWAMWWMLMDLVGVTQAQALLPCRICQSRRMMRRVTTDAEGVALHAVVLWCSTWIHGYWLHAGLLFMFDNAWYACTLSMDFNCHILPPRWVLWYWVQIPINIDFQAGAGGAPIGASAVGGSKARGKNSKNWCSDIFATMDFWALVVSAQCENPISSRHSGFQVGWRRGSILRGRVGRPGASPGGLWVVWTKLGQECRKTCNIFLGPTTVVNYYQIIIW